MFYDNLTMLTDLYELTMMNGYYLANKHEHIAVFDVFYRKNPSGNGYSVFAGLEQVIEYINNIKFTDEDIEYLSSLDIYDENFLEYLKTFKFTGEIYSMEEGSVIFPHEPIMRIKAPIMEAQLIESTVLNIINHQSLIATKATRILWATKGEDILEFGLRRAQGPDASLYGTRAAFIGGSSATSNVLAGKMFNIPVSGTIAHSWIMSFESELEAFREYARTQKGRCVFLVDTYDTINSGVPNAIKIMDEMKSEGRLPSSFGIRLDSGDIAYLSKEARKLLDAAGYEEAFICASNDLDEYLIKDLKNQNAKVTVWGVGTNLITSKDCPAFGGVYKLAAETDAEGVFVPKIKLSENVEKINNPGIKKVFRLYNKASNKIKADLITLEHESIDSSKDLVIFDQIATWKKMYLKAGEYYAKELLKPIFVDGQQVYKSPSVTEMRKHRNDEVKTLWQEHKRFTNPQFVPVDLSEELYNLKNDMLENIRI